MSLMVPVQHQDSSILGWGNSADCESPYWTGEVCPQIEEHVSSAVCSTAVVACLLPGLLGILYDPVTVSYYRRTL